MTNNNHPITPPPELVEEWFTEQRGLSEASRQHIATQAARWGADQEVGACCQWLSLQGYDLVAAKFRAARRPKPPSLKEQSLALIDKIQDSKEAWDISDLNVVRRALESLPD